MIEIINKVKWTLLRTTCYYYNNSQTQNYDYFSYFSFFYAMHNEFSSLGAKCCTINKNTVIVNRDGTCQWDEEACEDTSKCFLYLSNW